MSSSPEQEISAKLAQWLVVAVQLTETAVRMKAQRVEKAAASRVQQAGALRAAQAAQHQADRLRWARAADKQSVDTAPLQDIAAAWSNASAWADTDISAAKAADRFEARLRADDPVTMGRYHRYRSRGAGRVPAMWQTFQDAKTATAAAEARTVFVGEAGPIGGVDAFAAEDADLANNEADKAAPTVAEAVPDSVVAAKSVVVTEADADIPRAEDDEWVPPWAETDRPLEVSADDALHASAARPDPDPDQPRRFEWLRDVEPIIYEDLLAKGSLDSTEGRSTKPANLDQTTKVLQSMEPAERRARRVRAALDDIDRSAPVVARSVWKHYETAITGGKTAQFEDAVIAYVDATNGRGTAQDRRQAVRWHDTAVREARGDAQFVNNLTGTAKFTVDHPPALEWVSRLRVYSNATAPDEVSVDRSAAHIASDSFPIPFDHVTPALSARPATGTAVTPAKKQVLSR